MDINIQLKYAQIHQYEYNPIMLVMCCRRAALPSIIFAAAVDGCCRRAAFEQSVIAGFRRRTLDREQSHVAYDFIHGDTRYRNIIGTSVSEPTHRFPCVCIIIYIVRSGARVAPRYTQT